LAAVLSGKYAIEGRTVAVVASGGNVNRETFSQALGRHSRHRDHTARNTATRP
jgi:threonine dehydratase